MLGGGRPEKPEGVEEGWFTNYVWEVLERCWMPQPGDRPSIEDILQCLEEVSGFWTPPPVPPSAGLFTQESSDIILVESTDSSGTPPPSEMALPQPSAMLGLEDVAVIVNGVRLACPRRDLVLTQCPLDPI